MGEKVSMSSCPIFADISKLLRAGCEFAMVNTTARRSLRSNSMLLILLVLILFGGLGGGYYGYRGGAYGPAGFGGVGLIVVILVLFLLLGGPIHGLSWR
jgi:hypothetical protein